MILTSEETIAAVKKVLEEQVLPALNTASWTASNIRACLMLLTYAQDCQAQERSLLVDTNAAMASLFLEVLASTDLVWLTEDTRDTIDRTLKGINGLDDSAGIEELASLNMAGKRLLSNMIRRAALARTSPPSPADTRFRVLLHECLEVLARRDAQLTERARVMLPI